ncbi:MAG TPA: beta-galactosidase [Tepidisphaeraceae bacterium]|jgi:hypothetical protein
MGRKRTLLLSLLLACSASCTNLQSSKSHDSTIHYDNQCLTINGHDMVIFSGAFHYFRCPQGLWPERFAKIKAAGFNTVETYIPWNLCEPQMPAGLNDYSKIDLRGVKAWLAMAEHYGFYIIIRPGPYICAEWDHGGFPGWLINKRPANFPAEKVWLRSDDPTYIAWCKHWYNAVCPVLASHQITHKSPGSTGIILFQLENEYDYSGMSEDVKMSCVKSLAECATANGIDVPLFTCWTHSIRGNTDPVLSKVFDSCNFYPGWGVDRTGADMQTLRTAQPNAPMMTTELQGGWFTSPGDEQVLRPDSDHYRHDLVPAQIQNLTLFASQNGDTITNYYMLFGGTNFADNAAQGISTSYDYSAPIRENGGVGEKYRVVQALGDFIRAHGPSLARTTLVDCQATTGSSDVTLVERRGTDGSRYLFIRTNQHQSSRYGTAHLKESDGTEITFDYELPAFGSKVLYLAPGQTDPARGQWFPQERPPIHRPTKLPHEVTVTDIHSMPDPTPLNWKPMANGTFLPELGIYDSRFVYYDATLGISEDDLNSATESPASIFSDNPVSNTTDSSSFSVHRSSLTLKIDHPSGDHMIVMLNGHRIEPIAQTGETYYSPGDYLHAGDNHLRLLYENTGFANIGGGLEKRAGVSNITLTQLPGNDRAISHWQMHLIQPTDHPDVALHEADQANDWHDVSTDNLEAAQLRQHQWAVFQTKVDVSSQQLNESWTHLLFSRIDDEGWIFINGQLIGRGLRWDQPVNCDARSALHAGSNTIAVVIHNNDNGGGLGPVSWAPDHEPSIGSVSIRYADVPEISPKRWPQKNSAASESLLNWYRLTFSIPATPRAVWVPWLMRIHAHGNGFLYLNGHALGRYWEDGKQTDYFLPDNWLNRTGKNELTLCLRAVDQGSAIESATLVPYKFYAEFRH